MADVTLERVSTICDDGTRAVRDLEPAIGSLVQGLRAGSVKS
jgi:hypothetical protein